MGCQSPLFTMAEHFGTHVVFFATVIFLLAASADGEQHSALAGGGQRSRWVLFEGAFSEDLGWLLGAYADLARGFVEKITPYGFPWDPLIDIFLGTADLIQASIEIVKSEGGILAVSVVLLLLGLLVPISGMIFGLCRCCGNCGGVRSETRIRRLACGTGVVMGVVLLVLSLVILAAGCFAILSGERLSQSVHHFEGTVNSIMDDIDNFQDDLLRDLRQIGNLSEIVDDTMQSLSDAENTIFAPVISQYDSIVLPLNSSTTQLREDLTIPSASLTTTTGLLATTIAQVNTDGLALQTAMTNVANSLSTFITTDCPGSLPDTYGVCAFIPDHNPFATAPTYTMVNSYNFGPMSVYLATVGPALVTLSDALSTASSALAESQSSLSNATQAVIHDVGEILVEVESTAATATEEAVTLLQQSLGESLNTSVFRTQIAGYVDTVEEYDMYSYVAFIVFASLGFVISLMCVLGLLLGACGYNTTRRPSERSTTSNCGGKFMMSSAAWTFTFAIIFCLPTAIWFIIGANVTLLCDAMADLTIMDKVVDNREFWGGDTLLDSVVRFGDSPLNLTARHFIEDCQQDQTLYEALHLSSAGLLDDLDSASIDEFMPYVDTFRHNITTVITSQGSLGLIDFSPMVLALAPPAFPVISLMQSANTTKIHFGLDHFAHRPWFRAKWFRAKWFRAKWFLDEEAGKLFLTIFSKVRRSTELTFTQLLALTGAVPIQDTITSLNVFINKTWEAYDTHGSSMADFQQQVDNADAIITDLQSLATLQTNMMTLLTTYANQVTTYVTTYYEIQNLTTDALPNITTGAQDLNDFSANLNDTFISSVNVFIDGLVANAEELITGPVDKIENDIGHCGVVSESYETIVEEVCVHFLTGFNALWLSTGIISLCLLPAIIFNVRLSKYIRRAKPIDSYRLTEYECTDL